MAGAHHSPSTSASVLFYHSFDQPTWTRVAQAALALIESYLIPNQGSLGKRGLLRGVYHLPFTSS